VNLFEPGDRSAVSSVLPPLPSLVVGRDQQLEEIKQRLGIGTEEQRAITVVHGWPGVGKSTLVAKLAHDPEVGKHFPMGSCGLLWVNLPTYWVNSTLGLKLSSRRNLSGHEAWMM
jgi:hypothetical protein